ncbi:MAG: glycosyltransferase family 4 protein [Steroidobacteraceae bacterium]
MNQTRLSVVMFSAVLGHGGGRETWLSNILPELLALRAFEHIDVHYVADAETDAHDKLQICSDRRINFFETRLPVSSGKLTSVRRVAIFCSVVVRRLRRVASPGHCVVAVGTFYEGAVLALLRLSLRRPPTLVTWIRGVWSKEINHRHGYFLKQLICFSEKLFIRRSDYIISNGHDTKKFYEALLDRHVEAIPNALDLKKFAAMTRPAFQGEGKTIAYIGRLSEEKGFRSFLDAVAAYFTVHTSSTLSYEIVGDGPLRTLAEAFIAAHPGRSVRYLGPISNEKIPDYLSTIDAGVNLTYSKASGGGGVSNAMLELIGAGRLVIAWDSPIYKQVLDDHQALFVDENNIDELARSFARVEADPAEMCRRIESSGQVLSRYSLENHVQHFINYVRN